MNNLQNTMAQRLGRALQSRNDEITREPLPRRWVELINELNERERRAEYIADENRGRYPTTAPVGNTHRFK
jgi:hypothetical protein